MSKIIRFPRLHIALAISGLLCFSPAPHSETTPAINHVPANDYLLSVAAPLFPTITDENSEGLFFDIFREVFEKEGYSISTMIMPFKRSIRLLEQGKIDVYLTDWEHAFLTVESGYHPEKLYTPSQPISKELISAIYLSDNVELTGQNPLIKLASNTQRLIGWVKDYEYDSLFDLPPESFQTVTSSRQGLTMLQAGRLQLFLDDRDNSKVVIKQPDYKSASFEIIPLRDNPLYPVFQNTEKGLKLADIYDSRMIELHQNGRIEELYQKWGYDYDTYFPTPTTKE